MKMYAAYNNNSRIHQMGSSGSIYYSLASKVLDKNGIVFAAIYDEQFNVKHTCISNKEEFLESMGSKYVASNLGNTFANIESSLQNNKKVMFVGTPCQCAGLKSFLNQSSCDITNLITVDIVCQGVPSPKIWQLYLSEITNHKAIRKVNMRDKSQGWLNYSIKIDFEDNTYLIEDRYENAYLKGFVQCLFLRPSCYNCVFKGEYHYSDIQLGDLWGVNEFLPKNYQFFGTSLIICHSKKGEAILEEISDTLEKEIITDIDSVYKYNPCIVKSAPLPKNRSIFWSYVYKKLPYSRALTKTTHIPNIVKFIRRFHVLINKLKEHNNRKS